MKKVIDWKYPSRKYVVGVLFKKNKEIFVLRESNNDIYLSKSWEKFPQFLKLDIRERKIENLMELLNLEELLNLFSYSPTDFLGKRELFYLDLPFWSQFKKLPFPLKKYLARFPLLEKKLVFFWEKDFPFKYDFLSLAERLKFSYSNFRIFSSFLEEFLRNKKDLSSLKLELEKLIESKLKPNERWKKIVSYCEKILFPNFYDYQKKFLKIKEEVERFIPGVTLNTDEAFESGEYQLCFKFQNSNEYISLLEKLKKNEEIINKLDDLE